MSKSATNTKQAKRKESESIIAFWKKKLEEIQEERSRSDKEFSLVTATSKMVTTFLTKDIGNTKPLRLEINISSDDGINAKGLLDGLGHRIEVSTNKDVADLYEDFLKRIKRFDEEKAVTDNSRNEVRKFYRP